MVETALRDALRALPVPRPPAVQMKVESQMEPRAVARKALVAAHRVQQSAVPWVMAVESVRAQELSSPVRAQLALPRAVEPLPASLRERARAPWERWAQRLALWILEQPEPALQERQAVRQAQQGMRPARRLARRSGLKVSRPQQDLA
jgi:hypothetical protein